MFCLIAATDWFKSAVRLVVSIGVQLDRPYLYLAAKTLFTRSLISFLFNLPSLIADLIFFMVCSTSPGKQSISLPAMRACTFASPCGKYLLIAFISKASVTLIPLNPNSLRSKSFTALGDSEVAKFGVGSMAGTDKCATMMEAIPASIKALKGTNSNESNCARFLLMIGISKCESTFTSP